MGAGCLGSRPDPGRSVSAPSRRDRTRPLELLVIAAVLAAFTGIVVVMATRDVVLGLIFGVVAFIVSLVVFAMLELSMRPNRDEQLDLREQDEDQGPKGH